MNFVFRVDASPVIGTGHIMRSWALAEAALERGHPCHLLYNECPQPLLDRWQMLGVAHTQVDGISGTLAEAKATARVAKELEADWVILDGHHFGEGYQRTLLDLDIRFTAIDDYGHCLQNRASIIINQNASACEAWYEGLGSQQKLLLGFDYTILRSQFRELPRKPFDRSRPQNVLVTTGGTDPSDASLHIVRCLTKIETSKPITLRIIIGSLHPNKRRLDFLSEELRRNHSPIKLETASNVEDMPTMMDWADIAIVGAGTTLYELYQRSIPTLVITLVNNQISNALAAINRWKTSLDGGRIESLENGPLIDNFNRLMTDPDLRQILSEKCSQLVDGNGVYRVIETIEAYQPSEVMARS